MNDIKVTGLGWSERAWEQNNGGGYCLLRSLHCSDALDVSLFSLPYTEGRLTALLNRLVLGVFPCSDISKCLFLFRMLGSGRNYVWAILPMMVQEDQLGSLHFVTIFVGRK